MVSLAEAGTTLVIAALLAVYLSRLRTPRRLQKLTLQVSLVLFAAAILSNLLISTAPGLPSADLFLYSKRVQGIFDYLFAISIGAFVMAIVHPAASQIRQLFWSRSRGRPSSFAAYTAVFVLGILGIAWTPASLESLPNGGLRVVLPPEFVALVLFATSLFLAFAPAKLLPYVRAGRSRRRNILLVLAGIETYATAELLFEILLPNLGHDFRGIGFAVNLGAMALIAYAIKTRTFLEEILVSVPEAHQATEPKYRLEPGTAYLVFEDRCERGFEVFQDLVTHGHQGLCITRQMPRKVQAVYGLERTPILWLSRNVEDPSTVRPTPAEGVALAIEHFVESTSRGVVLLDGVEYLISHNDFRSVLTLLNDLCEIVAVRGAILLVPLNPEAVEPRELALLQRGTMPLPDLTADDLFPSLVRALPEP